MTGVKWREVEVCHVGMTEGKPGKTGAACGLWMATFVLALGAGLWTITSVLT